MVAIIVHQQSSSAVWQFDIAIFLEAAADTFKAKQAFLDRFNRCANFQRNSDSRQRIEDVVAAGHIQNNFKRLLLMSFHLDMNGKFHLRADVFNIGCVDISSIVQAVSSIRLAHFGQNRADVFAVDTQKRFAVERHTVDKINKRLVQFFDAVSVGVHVVFVDIGDDGHNRGQMQEGRIGLVGLSDDVFAFTQTGVGTCGIEFATDNESRIKTCRTENRSGQAGGCGFTVRTGNGDTIAEAHQFCQHQRAGNDGDLLLQRGNDFGIVFFDGSRGNDDIRTIDVFGSMAWVNLDAESAQMLSNGISRLIRTGNFKAQIV